MSSWSDDPELNGVTLKDGAPPDGPDEVVIDKLTADNNDFEVGDEITIVFDNGPATFRIVGLVGLGDTDGFGGATLAVFSAADAAADPRRRRHVRRDRHPRRRGRRRRRPCKAAIEDVLPPRTEVVTGEQVGEEASDSINEIISIFGTGLLIFAFITAFVAAFIINNVFGITIGQRLRELALLRGVGASTKQVRRLIVLEALIISVTATVLGILAGFGVAKLIIAIFNSAGAGFPSSSLILRPAGGDRVADRRRRRDDGERDLPRPARRQGAAGGGDATGDRLRRDQLRPTPDHRRHRDRCSASRMFLLGLFATPGGTIGADRARRRRRRC